MKMWSSLDTDDLRQKMEKSVMDLTPLIYFDDIPKTKLDNKL